MKLTQLRLEHLPQWADLLAIAFNRHPVDMIELLSYLQTTNGLTAWGAWDGRHLIAQYSCMRHHIQLPQQTAPSMVGMSINMAVHPDYRGKGLVKQVSKPVYDCIKAEGAVAGVGFSNADGVKVDRYSKRYDYQILGKMRSIVAWVVRRPRAKPLTLRDEWSERPFTPKPTADTIQFNNTPTWIQQRFSQHPFRDYRFGFWEEKDGQLRGVVVYRPFKRGKLSGVSLLTAWGDDSPQLLARWVAAIWQEGCRMIHMLSTPHSQLKNALMQTAVCIPLPYTRTPYYLTVKPLCDNLPDDLLDFTKWDCNGGDIL
ncbi:MAG: GNAT family N-acetyltransferase [Chloroflexi bacterium]|nr:GNAT family N-acetyltransferase [Chloroflexota bacterium]